MIKSIRLCKILLIIFLVLSSLNCKKKDDDDDNNSITDPKSGISAEFRGLLSGKTFYSPGYLTADNYFDCEFSDYTKASGDIKEITFDSKGLPSKFSSIDKYTSENTVKTIKIYSTLSSTRGIYQIYASNVEIDNNGTIGDVEMYIGIEIAANGNLLYQTTPVIQWRLSDEQSTISAQNVEWNTGQLVAVKSHLDAAATDTFKLWSLPTELKGDWVSTNTYTNISTGGKRFAEYGLLKIGDVNAGDIIFDTYDNNSLTPSRTDAIDKLRDNVTFYWDTISTKYDTETNKSYAFSLSANRYVAINTYKKQTDATVLKVRVYDVEVINRTPLQIRLNNAKYYGNKYKDLIFEKVDGITLP